MLEALAPFRLETALVASQSPGSVNGERLVIRTDPELLRMLGVKPALGMVRPGAVLTDGMWRSFFNRNPHVIGAVIHIDRETYRVTAVSAKLPVSLSPECRVPRATPRI